MFARDPFAYHQHYSPHHVRTAWDDMFDLFAENQMPWQHPRRGYGRPRRNMSAWDGYPLFVRRPMPSLHDDVTDLLSWGDSWPWGYHGYGGHLDSIPDAESRKLPTSRRGGKGDAGNLVNEQGSERALSSAEGASDDKAVATSTDTQQPATQPPEAMTMSTRRPSLFTNLLGEMSRLNNMAVDVVENEHDVAVRADLPGVEAKDVDVQVDAERGVLHIAAKRQAVHEEKLGRLHRIERSYGSVQRSVPIPHMALSETAEAQFDNGVLTVQFAKRPDEDKDKADCGPRKLKIRSASSSAACREGEGESEGTQTAATSETPATSTSDGVSGDSASDVKST